MRVDRVDIRVREQEWGWGRRWGIRGGGMGKRGQVGGEGVVLTERAL